MENDYFHNEKQSIYCLGIHSAEKNGQKNFIMEIKYTHTHNILEWK